MVNCCLSIDSKYYQIDESKLSDNVRNTLESSVKIEACALPWLFVEKTSSVKSLVKDLFFPLAQYSNSPWEKLQYGTVDLLTLSFRICTLFPKIIYDSATKTLEERETLDWIRNLGYSGSFQGHAMRFAQKNSDGQGYTISIHSGFQNKIQRHVNDIYLQAYKIGCRVAKNEQESQDPHSVNSFLDDPIFGNKAMNNESPSSAENGRTKGLNINQQMEAILFSLPSCLKKQDQGEKGVRRNVRFNADDPQIVEIPRIGTRRVPSRSHSRPSH